PVKDGRKRPYAWASTSSFEASKTWMAGTLSEKTRFALLPGHDGGQGLESRANDQAALASTAGSAALAFSTIAANAAGSWIARSDSTLRSTVTPDLARPSINRL